MGLIFDFPEGATPIDPEEAQDLIPSLSTQQELNEFELLNIAEAAEWAEKSRKVKQVILRPETLKLLHKRMFDKTWKWAGHYRVTQKSIGVEAYRIPSEIHNLLEDVKCWIEYSTYPPNEILARFHHRLVSIHPFPNGNGRHARLAVDLLCEIKEWNLPTWGSTDLARQSEVRTRYIKALKQADQNDLQALIDFIHS